MKILSRLFTGEALVAIACVAVGMGIGAALTALLPEPGGPQDVRQFNSTYHFINPLLACSTDADIGADEAGELEKAIESTIHAHTNAGDVNNVSVYYRDLNSGPWVGINYNEEFAPGSLLKVPLAMSIYKQAETDPSFLLKKLDYTGTEVHDQQYFAPAPFPAGEHTVEELVRQMLVNSDNDATNVLANAVGATQLEATYAHLGIAEPPTQGVEYTTTTHAYATFLRTLYNATYLDEADSEHLLSLLSQTSFTDGLVAGLPKGTAIAHKFGERAFADGMTVQLHDCGIVYAPNHPYIICVMTKGTEYPLLASTIADISRQAYVYTLTGKE